MHCPYRACIPLNGSGMSNSCGCFGCLVSNVLDAVTSLLQASQTQAVRPDPAAAVSQMQVDPAAAASQTQAVPFKKQPPVALNIIGNPKPPPVTLVPQPPLLMQCRDVPKKAKKEPPPEHLLSPPKKNRKPKLPPPEHLLRVPLPAAGPTAASQIAPARLSAASQTAPAAAGLSPPRIVHSKPPPVYAPTPRLLGPPAGPPPAGELQAPPTPPKYGGP